MCEIDRFKIRRIKMLRFISTAGPDPVSSMPAIDIRFWGSAPTWDEALALQAKVDQALKRAHLAAGMETYIAESMVIRDLRKRVDLFDGTLPMPYQTFYFVKNSDQHPNVVSRAPYETIGFDVFSAPPTVDWDTVCEKATQMLVEFSSGPPGGQRG
jgi:hypothetical protein